MLNCADRWQKLTYFRATDLNNVVRTHCFIYLHAKANSTYLKAKRYKSHTLLFMFNKISKGIYILLSWENVYSVYMQEGLY